MAHDLGNLFDRGAIICLRWDLLSYLFPIKCKHKEFPTAYGLPIRNLQHFKSSLLPAGGGRRESLLLKDILSGHPLVFFKCLHWITSTSWCTLYILSWKNKQSLSTTVKIMRFVAFNLCKSFIGMFDQHHKMALEEQNNGTISTVNNPMFGYLFLKKIS